MTIIDFDNELKITGDAWQALENVQLKTPLDKPVVVRFSAQTYTFKHPVHIRRIIHLQGEGHPGQIRLAGTVLHFPESGGFITHFPGTYASEPAAGSLLNITDMTILGEGKGHGIIAQSRLHATDVWIERFHHGVFIRGEMSAKPMTNANLCRLTGVSIYGCTDTGIRVAGGDANQSIFTALDVTNCGGVHIWDDSFLGNLWIGCHVDTAPPTGKNIAYRARNGSFMFCYSEGPTESQIHYPAIVYAGSMAIQKGYTAHHVYAAGPAWLGVKGALSAGEGSGVFGRLGDAQGPDVALSLVDNAHSGQDLRIHSVPGGWWTMRDTNSGYLDSMAWSNVANTTEGRGQVWLPRGMWYGGGAGTAGRKMHRTTSHRGGIDLDVIQTYVGAIQKATPVSGGTLIEIPTHGLHTGDIVSITAIGGIAAVEHVIDDVKVNSFVVHASADSVYSNRGLVMRCRAEGYAKHPPAAGSWSVADRIWLTKPSTKEKGWVCTSSGAPGLWSSF